MSRYPFMDYANAYLDTVKFRYAQSSVGDMERRFRRINQRLINLRTERAITTTSPKQLTSEDVKKYIESAANDYGELGAAVRRDITQLRHVCDFAGNHCVAQCLEKYPQLRPVVKEARCDSLEKTQVEKIVHAMETAEDDWAHVRAYALVMLLLGTGARNKELRLANLEDLDTDSWVLTIRHPKGEKTWGETRKVNIPPYCRPILYRYLNYRDEWATRVCADDVPALFPSPSSPDGYLSANSIRVIVRKVAKEAGVTFNPRDLRRTFGQIYIDMDLDVESVSVLMGHSTTKTTEIYYARKRNTDAMAKAGDVWSKNNSEDSNPKGNDLNNNASGIRDWCNHRNNQSFLPECAYSRSFPNFHHGFESAISKHSGFKSVKGRTHNYGISPKKALETVLSRIPKRIPNEAQKSIPHKNTVGILTLAESGLFLGGCDGVPPKQWDFPMMSPRDKVVA